MKRLIIVVVISGLLLLGVLVIMQFRSTPKQALTGAGSLVTTLPMVELPVTQKDTDYRPETDGDETTIPDDWTTKHPIYFILSGREDGFNMDHTTTLFRVIVTLKPKKPLTDPAREAELLSLQTQARDWMLEQARIFDPKATLDQLTIVWKQAR